MKTFEIINQETQETILDDMTYNQAVKTREEWLRAYPEDRNIWIIKEATQ